MKLQVTISKELIKRAMYSGTAEMRAKGDEGLPSHSCVVTLAFREIFPKAYSGGSVILSGNYPDMSATGIDLPRVAWDFMSKFDDLTSSPEERLKLEPIEFEVEIAEEIEKGTPGFYECISKLPTQSLKIIE